MRYYKSIFESQNDGLGVIAQFKWKEEDLIYLTNNIQKELNSIVNKLEKRLKWTYIRATINKSSKYTSLNLSVQITGEKESVEFRLLKLVITEISKSIFNINNLLESPEVTSQIGPMLNFRSL